MNKSTPQRFSSLLLRLSFVVHKSTRTKKKRPKKKGQKKSIDSKKKHPPSATRFEERDKKKPPLPAFSFFATTTTTPQGRRARAQKQLTHQPRGIPPRGDNDGTRDESSFDDAVWGVDDDERIDLQHNEAIILAEKKTHFREKPGASGNRRNLPGAARIVQMRDSSAHWTRGFCEANVPMGGHDVHRWGFGHVREANDDGGVE